MKLSIVIITKNEEKNLPNLLNSIKDQKINFDYEIIISDANSTDKTRQIAKDYWCKIVDGWLPSKWRNNWGKIAKWEWLLFIDADTVFNKGSILKWIDIVDKKNATIWLPYITWITKEKDRIWSMLWSTSFVFFNIFKNVCWPCILLKKSLFLEVWWYNEQMYLAEDLDFLKRINKIWKKINLLPTMQVSTRRLKKQWYINIMINYSKWTIQYLFFKKSFKKDEYENIYKF